MFPLISLVSVLAVADASKYATYPPVPHTASINGLADPVFSSLSNCARGCVSKSTSSTPCPYWDTGCLCVWKSWTSDVAMCIAQKCNGKSVTQAQSLIKAQCEKVGVEPPYWHYNLKAASMLEEAAGR